MERFLRIVEARQIEKAEKIHLMRANNVEFYCKKMPSVGALIEEATGKWKRR